MKRLTILLVTLGILAVVGYLFYKEGSLPVNSQDTATKIFIIQPGESLTSVIDKLSQEKLIRSKIVFYLLVKKLGIDKKIQAGDFRLSSAMSAQKMAEELTHGTLDKWLTIIEGLRKEEVAELVAKDFNIPTVEFSQLAQEGYLYPDTYLIPSGATTADILAILQKNFDSKITPQIMVKAGRLNLSEVQLLTMASIVEREALDNDRDQIASILVKRLKNDYPLQVDATIQYALGYQIDQKSWWKKELSLDDLKIDSPYNTYKNTGLPPGPIASPGIASINAVVNADTSTPYMFYLHDAQGKTHYARTLEEHQKNIEKYLQ